MGISSMERITFKTESSVYFSNLEGPLLSASNKKEFTIYCRNYKDGLTFFLRGVYIN